VGLPTAAAPAEAKIKKSAHAEMKKPGACAGLFIFKKMLYSL
jgi:hypothetical protein